MDRGKVFFVVVVLYKAWKTFSISAEKLNALLELLMNCQLLPKFDD